MLPANTDRQRDRLEKQAPRVLDSIRQRFGEIIKALPGPPERAVEVAETLGLDRSLGWKIWKVARGNDVYPSPKHIPGAAGIELFLNAAVTKGVSDDLIVAARSAFEGFEQLIRDHAGDRATLDSMLSRFTTEGHERHEIAVRRDGFRAASHAFGVQARTLFGAQAVFPGGTGRGSDRGVIHGNFGLHRMRAGTSWVLRRSGFFVKEGPVAARGFHRLPLEETAGESEAPGHAHPIRAFCSQPLPEVRWVEAPGEFQEYVLAPGPVGKSGAIDWVCAEHVTQLPTLEDPRDAATIMVHTPCERLCFDLFLHRQISDGELPELRVDAALFGGVRMTDERDRIPVVETVIDMGTADRAPAAPEVPRHREMIQFVFDRLGLDLREFRAYRVRTKYPPIPIAIMLWWNKPSRSNA